MAAQTLPSSVRRALLIATDTDKDTDLSLNTLLSLVANEMGRASTPECLTDAANTITTSAQAVSATAGPIEVSPDGIVRFKRLDSDVRQKLRDLTLQGVALNDLFQKAVSRRMDAILRRNQQ